MGELPRGAGWVWLQALPPVPGEGQGTPLGGGLGPVRPSQQENEVFSSSHWGLAAGTEPSPQTPVPSPTLSRDEAPGAEQGPRSKAGQADGRGWSLWHLQGRDLRLHLEVLVEADHCVPGEEGRAGHGRGAGWALQGQPRLALRLSCLDVSWSCFLDWNSPLPSVFLVLCNEAPELFHLVKLKPYAHSAAAPAHPVLLGV